MLNEQLTSLQWRAKSFYELFLFVVYSHTKEDGRPWDTLEHWEQAIWVDFYEKSYTKKINFPAVGFTC